MIHFSTVSKKQIYNENFFPLIEHKMKVEFRRIRKNLTVLGSLVSVIMVERSLS